LFACKALGRQVISSLAGACFLNIDYFDKSIYIISEYKYFWRNTMPRQMAKEQAHYLVDKMPENSTWDDLIHEIYVRQVIEEGLADSMAGRTKDVKEIREKYGLPE
jgi:hypothetical protein